MVKLLSQSLEVMLLLITQKSQGDVVVGLIDPTHRIALILVGHFGRHIAERIGRILGNGHGNKTSDSHVAIWKFRQCAQLAHAKNSIRTAPRIRLNFERSVFLARMTLGDLMQLDKVEKQRLLQSIAELKQQHREMDISIDDMAERVNANQFEIKRLKKEKLRLKDAIIRLESKLIPDLHA